MACIGHPSDLALTVRAATAAMRFMTNLFMVVAALAATARAQNGKAASPT